MPRRGTHSYLMIDSIPKLEKFAGRLEKQKIIGVDLEADSMYHFKEKVCMIQIATQHTTAVIDPLQIKNLSVLKPFKRYFMALIMTCGLCIEISE